jgi:hypothetical protein
MQSFSTQGHLNDHIKKHKDGKIIMPVETSNSKDSTKKRVKGKNDVTPERDNSFSYSAEDRGVSNKSVSRFIYNANVKH